MICAYPDLPLQKLRMIVLPDVEDRVIVSWIIRLDKTPERDRMTDRRTDGQVCRGYYSTVKILLLYGLVVEHLVHWL